MYVSIVEVGRIGCGGQVGRVPRFPSRSKVPTKAFVLVPHRDIVCVSAPSLFARNPPHARTDSDKVRPVSQLPTRRRTPSTIKSSQSLGLDDRTEDSEGRRGDMGGCGLLSDFNQFCWGREEAAMHPIVHFPISSTWGFLLNRGNARSGDVRSHKPTPSTC